MGIVRCMGFVIWLCWMRGVRGTGWDEMGWDRIG